MVAGIPNYEKYVMAIHRVEALLRNVTTALDNAGIPYAVVGGNAVAAWVASVDEDATRTTKDVDLLVRRDDIPAIAAAVAPLGMYADEAGGINVLLDRERPRPSAGVHLLIACELIRRGGDRYFPDVTESVRSTAGFRVIELLPLTRMKLEAHRLMDQVHLQDLLRLGLITPEIARALPDDLLDRLRAIRDTMEWTAPKPAF